MTFTELDGVVLEARGTGLGLREQLTAWRTWEPQGEPWQFELGYNHEHPTMTLDRYGLRLARHTGAEWGVALSERFPERRFLVVYRDEQISFCQFTQALPLGITPGERTVSEYCVVCEQRTPSVSRSLPDPEFPRAQFADCAVCGNEKILWADQEVVLASKAAHWHWPTSAVLDEPQSMEELKRAVLELVHPHPGWHDASLRPWQTGEPRFQARTLLLIEVLTELLLTYRVRQPAQPLPNPERLGIPRSSLLYHPARRALASVTVFTTTEETTTSHVLLNATDTRYQAGRQLESRIYEGRFGYGTRDTREHPLWHTAPNGQQVRVVSDIAPHAAPPWSSSPYGVGMSLKSIQTWGPERCVAFTVLFDQHQRVLAQHRRLFCDFASLDLDPEPVIELSLSDGVLTLRSKVFVWGVFLGWQTSKLPDNAFDLLPGIPYSLPWDEGVCGTPKIRLRHNLPSRAGRAGESTKAA